MDSDCRREIISTAAKVLPAIANIDFQQYLSSHYTRVSIFNSKTNTVITRCDNLSALMPAAVKAVMSQSRDRCSMEQDGGCVAHVIFCGRLRGGVGPAVVGPAVGTAGGWRSSARIGARV